MVLGVGVGSIQKDTKTVMGVGAEENKKRGRLTFLFECLYYTLQGAYILTCYNYHALPCAYSINERRSK